MASLKPFEVPYFKTEPGWNHTVGVSMEDKHNAHSTIGS